MGQKFSTAYLYYNCVINIIVINKNFFFVNGNFQTNQMN